MGLNVTLSTHTDSAAAVGICKTAGVGRVRRLAVGKFGSKRVCDEETSDCGDANSADALTKYFSQEFLDWHVAALSLKRLGYDL